MAIKPQTQSEQQFTTESMHVGPPMLCCENGMAISISLECKYVFSPKDLAVLSQILMQSVFLTMCAYLGTLALASNPAKELLCFNHSRLDDEDWRQGLFFLVVGEGLILGLLCST